MLKLANCPTLIEDRIDFTICRACERTVPKFDAVEYSVGGQDAYCCGDCVQLFTTKDSTPRRAAELAAGAGQQFKRNQGKEAVARGGYRPKGQYLRAA